MYPGQVPVVALSTIAILWLKLPTIECVCPDGYEEVIKGFHGCFKLVSTESKSFNDAKTLCELEGAQLPTHIDPDSGKPLVQFYFEKSGNTPSTNIGVIWLGIMRDSETSDSSKWLDGEPVTGPINYRKPETNLLCVNLIDNPYNPSFEPSWEAEECGYAEEFLCMKPKVKVLCETSCYCNETFDKEAALRSPMKFTSNKHCTYNLSTSQGTAINISFDGLMIPNNDCCFQQSLLIIDLKNQLTTRICGEGHDPILVRSNEVVLFVKGANETNAFGYNLTLQAVDLE